MDTGDAAFLRCGTSGAADDDPSGVATFSMVGAKRGTGTSQVTQRRELPLAIVPTLKVTATSVVGRCGEVIGVSK